MTSSVASARTTAGVVWQTRLPRDLAEAYEEDLESLGVDRSEALRLGLRMLHTRAVEARMAADVEQFYGSRRAPLSDVTAAMMVDERSNDVAPPSAAVAE